MEVRWAGQGALLGIALFQLVVHAKNARRARVLALLVYIYVRKCSAQTNNRGYSQWDYIHQRDE